MSKSGHKTPNSLSDVKSGRSTPHYARSTKESRNKERKKNVSPVVKTNRIPPSRSPRLCEDSPQVTDLNLEIRVGVHGHKPNLSTGSQPSDNWRKNSHTTPTSCRDVFQERLESEVNNYKLKLFNKDSEIERLICKLEIGRKLLANKEKEIEELNEKLENDKKTNRECIFSKYKEIEKLKSILDNDHRNCKKQLSMKDKEIERLKGMVDDRYNPHLHVAKMFKYEHEMSKKSELIKEHEIQILQNREKHKDNLQRTQLKCGNSLQEYLEVISSCKREISRLTSELQRRIEDNEKLHELSMRMKDKIRDHETKYEKMYKNIEKYEEINIKITDSNVEKEDRIRKLETELCQHKSDLQTSEKNYKLLHIEFEEGARRIAQLKKKESSINELQESKTHLQMKLDAVMEENKRLNQHILRLEDFKSKYYLVKSDNKHVWENCLDLKRKFEDKMSELEVVTSELDRYSDRVTQLEKEIGILKKFSAPPKTFVKREILEVELVDNRETSEGKVSELSKEINVMKVSHRQTADEKLQASQEENTSLRSALSKASTLIEELSDKCTNLLKDREDAECKVTEFLETVEEKETELELLRKHLARSEEKVSELSKEINVMKVSHQQTADAKLQASQEENTSLQSALSKVSTQNEDLSNKCTNLQKYKTDAEQKLSKLSKAVKEKENEISRLKKDQERIEELSDKCTNLLKDREDAEYKVNELLKAVEEKETDLELLRKHLARSEENVSKLSKEINVIKLSHRQTADEKLQAFQKENNSLQLALSKATIQIEDLSNKCRDLEKYKRDVEHNFSKLSNTVEEKEREIGSLKKYKEWYEDSLNKCTNLEKNITDLEHETSMLSNLLEEKENEMISVIKDLERAEENISKSQITDEKLQSLKKENASLESAVAKKATEMKDLLNKYTNLQKNNADAEQRLRKLSNEVEKYEYEIKQLKTHIETLKSKNTDLKIGKEEAEKKVSMLNDALDEKKIDTESMSRDLERLKDLSQKYNHLQIANANAELNFNNLYKKEQEKEREIENLMNEIERKGHIDSAGNFQKLTEENASLKLALDKQVQETEKRVSALAKEIENLQKSKETSSEKYNAKKLYDENEFLKAQLDRTSRSYEQLRKDYNEVKREKDHALNRLSSVAGEKLRNNNPGIADLSDENRPINLGEKFSQLYDDQWTDAIENLEQMHYSETDGIRCLLDILKAVFDECVKVSDNHFNKLKELTGTSHLSNDQLKKLKDLRKATAIHSVANTKQVVNDHMSKTFSKEKAACQTYIDRSIELCWLMSVQDPPVVIDFTAVHGQAIDDKILRKFTKTGSKIDFLVWPVIRLHEKGPLLQKGVVQPI